MNHEMKILPTILTFTGVTWNLEAPRAVDVRLVDIAHALSHLCRYTGHTRWFYSVGQHSWIMARALETAYPDRPAVALWGLLHDAPEAYLGDVTRPLKAMLGERYTALEEAHERAIMAGLGLPMPTEEERAIVKVYDLAMVGREQYAMFDGRPEPCDGLPIRMLDAGSPLLVRDCWRGTYDHLRKKMGVAP